MNITTDYGEHNVVWMCPSCYTMVNDKPDDKCKCTFCSTSGSSYVDIDACIADSVRLINKSKSIRTVSSCEGHQLTPGHRYVNGVPYITLEVVNVHGMYYTVTFNRLFDPKYLPRIADINLEWDWNNILDPEKDVEQQTARFMFARETNNNIYPLIRISMNTNKIVCKSESLEEVFSLAQTTFLTQLTNYAEYISKNF